MLHKSITYLRLNVSASGENDVTPAGLLHVIPCYKESNGFPPLIKTLKQAISIACKQTRPETHFQRLTRVSDQHGSQSSSKDPVQPSYDDSFAGEYEVYKLSVEGFAKQMKPLWDLELPECFKDAEDDNERKLFFLEMVTWASKKCDEKLEGKPKAQHAQAMFGVIEQKGREILNKYFEVKRLVPESSGATEDEEQAA